MSGQKTRLDRHKNGFVLPLVIIAIVVLAALAVGSMMSAYGTRLQAVKVKNETEAMLAAEAGYERAVFWMSQQTDIISALQDGYSGSSGSLAFEAGTCDYAVDFDNFVGARPVFRVLSTGASGTSTRVVDTLVVQAISGWVMGKCRVPSGPATTNPVFFANSEIIDIRLHINYHRDNPDERDIYITGTPTFRQMVDMGEGREDGANHDKYDGVMERFDDGVYFDQPDARITDEAAVASKVNRFRESTKPLYVFTPAGTADITRPHAAVQLEFFVEGEIGKVRITDNCTVRGYQRGGGSDTTWDYELVPGSTDSFRKYDIYAYHYAPDDQPRVTVEFGDTYVTQKFGTKESAPGGQIFVDGDVVIGSADFSQMVVKGKMTVVATGNIWIADSIVVDGPHDPATGLPSPENPNVLGLVARKLVKVVDPGISSYSAGGTNAYPGSPASSVDDRTDGSRTHSYRAIGNGAGSDRYLPDTTIIEAAVTVGGGGWGAENVRRGSYGGRREYSGPQDYLILRGTITEAFRGVVGLIGADGYLKNYYLDARLLEGILPGDLWFSGKYVPAPAGWHDYRPEI